MRSHDGHEPLEGPRAVFFCYTVQLPFRLARKRLAQGLAQLALAALVEAPALRAHDAPMDEVLATVRRLGNSPQNA